MPCSMHSANNSQFVHTYVSGFTIRCTHEQQECWLTIIHIPFPDNWPHVFKKSWLLFTLTVIWLFGESNFFMEGLGKPSHLNTAIRSETYACTALTDSQAYSK